MWAVAKAAARFNTGEIPKGTSCSIILPDGTVTEAEAGEHEYKW